MLLIKISPIMLNIVLRNMDCFIRAYSLGTKQNIFCMVTVLLEYIDQILGSRDYWLDLGERKRKEPLLKGINCKSCIVLVINNVKPA